MKEESPDTDRKLLDSLERLSEAFQILKGKVAREKGLSTLQLRVLVHLQEEGKKDKTNSSLARDFGLTKATMSETVQALLEQGLIERKPSQKDRRSQILSLSRKGKRISEELSGYSHAFQAPLEEMDQEEKEALIRSLHRIIHGLIQNGVISVQRICYTCRFYRKDGKGRGYCDLLELVMNEPRTNCEIHEPAKES